MTKPMMNVKQLAEYLGMSPVYCYRLVSERRIPFVRLGSTLRFDPVAIEAWVASRSTEPVR